MDQARILVTGATGLTGRAVIAQLHAMGVPSRALVRSISKAKSSGIESLGASLVEGDLSDSVSLADAMAGMNAGYLNIVPGPDALQQVDNFINAARAAGLKHIVKLSGLNASENSPSAIIRLHAEADRRVRESGIAFTILRANSFFQNFLQQVPDMVHAGEFYLPLGEARQSFIDVNDIAEVAAKRLIQDSFENASFDLTGPESLSLDQVAQRFAESIGKEIKYIPISSEVFKAELQKAGLPPQGAASVAELFETFANGEYSDVSDDVSNLLGRAPSTLSDFTKQVSI